MPVTFPKLGALAGIEAFRARLDALDIAIPLPDAKRRGPDSALAKPWSAGALSGGNRFAIQPMEGWDGTTDGMPTEPMKRRWRRFGESGAKLIWGGEAFAVRPEGRANPNQLYLSDQSLPALTGLLHELVSAHRERFERVDDLVVGLQLTHSGRFCRPTDKKRMEPVIAYAHPILNKKFGLPPDYPVVTDSEIRAIIDDYVRAAEVAASAGFHFVDIKHCHGYLGHELLSAHTRAGDFGGSFENRTRFLREIVAGVRAVAPSLAIGVRLCAFDFVPFKPGADRIGEPEEFAHLLPYKYGFGVDSHNPVNYDLAETYLFVDLLRSLDIQLLNLTAGSPYYNPHIQRPAFYPPSDGYLPPEDPLCGVARQMEVTRLVKQRCPEMVIVGTGYTYLQEFLPAVAQAAVEQGWADIVGIGRLVLSYPTAPTDLITGDGALHQPKLLCRTFSDCTTGPRNGLPSGCYPLDSYYKNTPDHKQLLHIKANLKAKE